jgi:hypothetical protein
MRGRGLQSRVVDFIIRNPNSAIRNRLPLLHIKTKVKSGSQCLTVLRIFSGDHTVEETPVPIPNTAVKLSGPMIVPTSAKVGIARFYFKNPA